MERMVNYRLVHRLAQRGYFSPFQSGFRLGRATMDAILMLDRDIKRALVNKEAVIGVFLEYREGL
uniref:Reverse transcriptase domain-containing protein n=1 Tax=Anguilla anguilla TaxID=7936 RepID=A0A0E9T6N9_ANGAN